MKKPPLPWMGIASSPYIGVLSMPSKMQAYKIQTEDHQAVVFATSEIGARRQHETVFSGYDLSDVSAEREPDLDVYVGTDGPTTTDLFTKHGWCFACDSCRETEVSFDEDPDAIVVEENKSFGTIRCGNCVATTCPVCGEEKKDTRDHCPACARAFAVAERTESAMARTMVEIRDELEKGNLMLATGAVMNHAPAVDPVMAQVLSVLHPADRAHAEVMEEVLREPEGSSRTALWRSMPSDVCRRYVTDDGKLERWDVRGPEWTAFLAAHPEAPVADVKAPTAKASLTFPAGGGVSIVGADGKVVPLTFAPSGATNHTPPVFMSPEIAAGLVVAAAAMAEKMGVTVKVPEPAAVPSDTQAAVE